MRRVAILATVFAVVALAAFALPALAQGPLGGGGMMGGWGPGQPGGPNAPFGYGPGGMTPALACGASVGGWLPGQTITPTVPYGYGRGGMMGRGMMGGMMGRSSRGGMTPALACGATAGGWLPGQTITPTVPYGRGGMMGGYGAAPNAKALTIDQAVTTAQQYVAAYKNTDLKLVEIEEYASNFYGVVTEKSTGTNAFQILIDRYTGAVYPEMGPNMMWNTKYSPMASRMGGVFSQPATKMTVTLDQARANAAQYLKTNLPNTTVEDKGDTFYGYYNFDVLQNGKTTGMLSVNGYTGAVWYHTWHGTFISAKSLE